MQKRRKKKPDTQINAQQNVFICGREIRINDSFLWTSWSSASMASGRKNLRLFICFPCATLDAVGCSCVLFFFSPTTTHSLHKLPTCSLLIAIVYADFRFFLLYLSCSPISERHSTMYKYKTIAARSVMQTVQFHNVQLFLINFDCFSHDGAMRYGSKTLLHTFAIFWALGLRAHNNSFIRKEGRDKWWWLWSENENDKSNFKWEISLCSLGQGRHVCWDASKTTEGSRQERGCVRGYGKKFKDFLSISKRRMWNLFGVRNDDT